MSDLSLGELAVNTYHGRFYTEKNDGSAAIVEVGSNPATFQINDAYSFPTSDGTNGQVLKTNGSGTLSFGSATSGGAISVFKFTVTSNTTVFTGNDDDSNSLLYVVGNEQVFLNGVKLVKTSDYVATNTTAVTLQANAVASDVIVIKKTQVTGVNDPVDLVEPADIQSSDTNLITLDTFAIGTYRSAKYLVQANTSDSFAVSEAVVTHNGSASFYEIWKWHDLIRFSRIGKKIE